MIVNEPIEHFKKETTHASEHKKLSRPSSKNISKHNTPNKRMEKEYSPRQNLNMCLKTHFDFDGVLYYSNEGKIKRPETQKNSCNDHVAFHNTYISPTFSY